MDARGSIAGLRFLFPAPLRQIPVQLDFSHSPEEEEFYCLVLMLPAAAAAAASVAAGRNEEKWRPPFWYYTNTVKYDGTNSRAIGRFFSDTAERLCLCDGYTVRLSCVCVKFWIFETATTKAARRLTTTKTTEHNTVLPKTNWNVPREFATCAIVRSSASSGCCCCCMFAPSSECWPIARIDDDGWTFRWVCWLAIRSSSSSWFLKVCFFLIHAHVTM